MNKKHKVDSIEIDNNKKTAINYKILVRKTSMADNSTTKVDHMCLFVYVMGWWLLGD